MEKADLKRELRHLYSPSTKEPAIVDVPPMSFVMVDGRGNPNTAKEYQDALQTLYPVSYTIKFSLKKSRVVDFAVMPLEGLWWTDAGTGRFEMKDLDTVYWTAMIAQHPKVTRQHVDDAIHTAEQKRSLPSIRKVRFESYAEGLSVQIMYVGPYSAEAPTIERLHRYAEEKGYSLRGKHHEIYLGDPRRTAPEKLKTVIRQPVG